jgi:hypothetical protein
MSKPNTATVLFAAFILIASAVPSGLAAATPKATKRPPGNLKFRVQQLHLDNNEGCDVADYNNDGQPDISAGEFWYPGPRFTEKKPVRKLEPFLTDYLTNNGEHAYDVNGDGWMDIVSSSFMDPRICWYENPKAEGLKRGDSWRQHVLIDTGLVQNESSELHDLDRDGVPEYVVSSYRITNPMRAYKFARDEQRVPILEAWTIHPAGPASNGHGMGFGDINGDGREDIVYGNGWYEQPGEGASTKPWIPHADWKFPQASAPMLVLDLSGDGRNDIIWGQGHNYGLFWEERRDDNRDGSTNWRHHTIDDKFSQAHCLVWEDLDNDGKPELITGRRFKAHSGNDPGDADPGCLYYFKWNPETRGFTKYVIAENGPGIGLQIRISDLDRNGWKDIVVAGKSGTHVLWNQGK